MKRAILTPAVLPASALIELKQWLGITTTSDDAPLQAVLRAAVEICEAFTGAIPLQVEAEEILPVSREWQAISSQPVQSITLVEAVGEDSSRTALAATDHELELDANGQGFVRVANPGDAKLLAVRFVAGLAADWDSLPEPLRHGIVRLAAHQHRERESSGASPLPPASVAALWRPWRRMRLT
jgi:uncharacterized phiE125 gp8 family phage protein